MAPKIRSELPKLCLGCTFEPANKRSHGRLAPTFNAPETIINLEAIIDLVKGVNLLDVLGRLGERRRTNLLRGWGVGGLIWGFGVWGLGFGVWDLGFGVWGLGLRPLWPRV